MNEKRPEWIGIETEVEKVLGTYFDPDDAHALVRDVVALCARVRDEAARRARTEALLEAVKIPWGPNHAKEILALIYNEVKPRE